MLADQLTSCQINRDAWEKCIEALLHPEDLDCSQADRAALLFLLDDNFYYPSMRYEVYQLARKCKNCFLCTTFANNCVCKGPCRFCMFYSLSYLYF